MRSRILGVPVGTDNKKNSYPSASVLLIYATLINRPADLSLVVMRVFMLFGVTEIGKISS